jgi:hypothetical protein
MSFAVGRVSPSRSSDLARAARRVGARPGAARPNPAPNRRAWPLARPGRGGARAGRLRADLRGAPHLIAPSLAPSLQSALVVTAAKKAASTKKTSSRQTKSIAKTTEW